MRLITLGDLRLEGAEVARSKPLLLLCYLALEGPRFKRDLAELFFPDSKDRADALSTTLRRLRPLGVLEERGQRLTPLNLSCDALEFLAGERRVYMGPFLDGLSLNLNPQLEEWILETREKLSNKRRELHLGDAEVAWIARDFATLEREIEALLALRGAPPLEEQDLARLLALSTPEGRLRKKLEAEGHSLGLSLVGLNPPQPSPAPATATPHNLRYSVTSFVGRNLERLKIAGLLRGGQARLVTLHGPGGIGKTRLALQTAHDALEERSFPDGVYFVPLDALSQAHEVVPHLLTTLHLDLQVGEAPLEALVRQLSSKRMLLVLDNFETLLDASDALNALLGRCARLALLVTSRVRLNLKAEWLLTLEGLSLPPVSSPQPDPQPNPKGTALEAFYTSDAVRLFLERAGQAQLGFVLSPDNEVLVHRLCTLCGGFPLALELTAAWLRTHTLQDILRSLETQGIALETPLQDVRHRHRSMAGALEHSWNLLSLQEQKGLAQLSVFEGGFTLEAALAVCRVDRTVLEHLVSQSLINMNSQGRFRFHPLIGEFARSKLLEDRHHARAVQERHAHYYLESLHRLNLEAGGGVSKALFAFLKPEEGNAMAALRYLLEHRRYPDLAQIAEPLLWHFPLNGRFADGIRVCAEVIGHWPDEAEEGFEALAAFLNSYAWLTYIAGNLAQAHSLCHRAWSVAQRCGSELQTLRALGHLGEIACMQGEHSVSLEHLNAALASAQRYGDPTRCLRVLNCLGIAQAMGDGLESALVTLAKSRRLLERGDAQVGMDAATFYIDLAAAHLMRDEYEAGLGVAWAGIKVAQAIGSSGHQSGLYGLVIALSAHQLKGESNSAGLEALEQLYQHNVAEVRRTREPFAHTLTLMGGARLALHQGQVAHCLALLLESLHFSLESAAWGMFTWLLPALTEAYLRLSDSTRAAEVIGFLLSAPTAGVWVRRQALSARDRLYAITDLECDLEQIMQRGSRLSLIDLLHRLRVFESALER